MIIDRAESLKNSSWKCRCSTSYQARHFSSGSPLFYRTSPSLWGQGYPWLLLCHYWLLIDGSSQRSI